MTAKIVVNIEFDVLLEQFKKLLKRFGLKYTKQRELLLKALYNSGEHFTPESLCSSIRELDTEANIGIATVYRSLKLLEDNGLVTSINLGAAGKIYELANKPHHDHMICKNCNLIIEFEDPEIERLQVKAAKKYDFKLSGHLMQLYGLCSSCQQEK